MNFSVLAAFAIEISALRREKSRVLQRLRRWAKSWRLSLQRFLEENANRKLVVRFFEIKKILISKIIAHAQHLQKVASKLISESNRFRAVSANRPDYLDGRSSYHSNVVVRIGEDDQESDVPPSFPVFRLDERKREAPSSWLNQQTAAEIVEELDEKAQSLENVFSKEEIEHAKYLDAIDGFGEWVLTICCSRPGYKPKDLDYATFCDIIEWARYLVSFSSIPPPRVRLAVKRLLLECHKWIKNWVFDNRASLSFSAKGMAKGARGVENLIYVHPTLPQAVLAKELLALITRVKADQLSSTEIDLTIQSVLLAVSTERVQHGRVHGPARSSSGSSTGTGK
jgi:hypothetical protein